MKNGLQVTAQLSEFPVEGVIVGSASKGLAPLWIIECTDGTLPSEVYPYKTFVCPEGMIYVHQRPYKDLPYDSKIRSCI